MDAPGRRRAGPRVLSLWHPFYIYYRYLFDVADYVGSNRRGALSSFITLLASGSTAALLVNYFFDFFKGLHPLPLIHLFFRMSVGQ